MDLFADSQLEPDPEPTPEWRQLADMVSEMERENEVMRARIARVGRVLRHAHGYTNALEMALTKIEGVLLLNASFCYHEDRDEIASIIRAARASPYNRG
jgi:hypothetical protein